MTRKKPAKRLEDTIEICPANLVHAPDIAELRKTCFCEVRKRMAIKLGGMLAAKIWPDDDFGMTQASLLITSGTHLIARPTCSIDVVGFLSVQTSGYIDCMCVHPKYRRRHIASRLIQTCLSDSGFDFLYADATTETCGAPARAFYESLGMKAVPFMRYVRRI